MPGNCKSLWQAVKLAKNQGPEALPPNMSVNGNQVPLNRLSDAFAEFFDRKVVGIVESTRVDQGVYKLTLLF